jgi:predicted helicase
MERMIAHYNRVAAQSVFRNIDYGELKDDQIKWTDRLKSAASNGVVISIAPEKIAVSLYRPFCVQYLYFDDLMVQRRYQLPRMFGDLAAAKTPVIIVSGIGSSKPFQTLSSDHPVCFDCLEKSQIYSFQRHDKGDAQHRDNITDWGLEQFRTHYNDATIAKLDIFHYVYGILHDPAYRTKYAANLKRELPRIPFAEDFRKLAEIGKHLMDIHVYYEDQPEFPLEENWSIPKGYRTPYGDEVKTVNDIPLRERYRVVKMKRNKKNPTEIIVNDFLTLKGLPPNVDDYKLGNRSAVDWVIDQYQNSTDKRSGITNDPNRDDDPTYIVRLIKKVVTVSVETVEVVSQLTLEQ